MQEPRNLTLSPPSVNSDTKAIDLNTAVNAVDPFIMACRQAVDSEPFLKECQQAIRQNKIKELCEKLDTLQEENYQQLFSNVLFAAIDAKNITAVKRLLTYHWNRARLDRRKSFLQEYLPDNISSIVTAYLQEITILQPLQKVAFEPHDANLLKMAEWVYHSKLFGMAAIIYEQLPFHIFKRIGFPDELPCVEFLQEAIREKCPAVAALLLVRGLELTTPTSANLDTQETKTENRTHQNSTVILEPDEVRQCIKAHTGETILMLLAQFDYQFNLDDFRMKYKRGYVLPQVHSIATMKRLLNFLQIANYPDEHKESKKLSITDYLRTKTHHGVTALTTATSYAGIKFITEQLCEIKEDDETSVIGKLAEILYHDILVLRWFEIAVSLIYEWYDNYNLSDNSLKTLVRNTMNERDGNEETLLFALLRIKSHINLPFLKTFIVTDVLGPAIRNLGGFTMSSFIFNKDDNTKDTWLAYRLAWNMNPDWLPHERCAQVLVADLPSNTQEQLSWLFKLLNLFRHSVSDSWRLIPSASCFTTLSHSSNFATFIEQILYHDKSNSPSNSQVDSRDNVSNYSSLSSEPNQQRMTEMRDLAILTTYYEEFSFLLENNVHIRLHICPENAEQMIALCRKLDSALLEKLVHDNPKLRSVLFKMDIAKQILQDLVKEGEPEEAIALIKLGYDPHCSPPLLSLDIINYDQDDGAGSISALIECIPIQHRDDADNTVLFACIDGNDIYLAALLLKAGVFLNENCVTALQIWAKEALENCPDAKEFDEERANVLATKQKLFRDILQSCVDYTNGPHQGTASTARTLQALLRANPPPSHAPAVSRCSPALQMQPVRLQNRVFVHRAPHPHSSSWTASDAKQFNTLRRTL